MAELTHEAFEKLLLDELSAKHPVVRLTVSKGDGTEWLVEVHEPIQLTRTFRPQLPGSHARAQLLVAELDRLITERS